jgi:Tfp pilus assembly protein PilF
MQRVQAELRQAFDAFEDGHLEVAIQLCNTLLASPETSGELYFLLGLIANKRGHHAESVEWLGRAAQTMPPSLRLWSALGGAWQAAGDLPRAGEYFTRCLQLDPQCQEACLRLADVCYELRKMELAAPLYRRAAGLDPQAVYAWRKLADTLRNLGELDEALAAYDQALSISPDDPVIHANRGRTLLAAGQLDEGFHEFQFRWEPMGLRHYAAPIWAGESLPGKTLFVFAEQGMGDTLQFVRFLPQARKRVGRLILECQPPLRSLLGHSQCADALVVSGEEPPAFDCYVPLLHLPAIFHVTLDTLPAAVPYLSFGATATLPITPGEYLKVGLVWAGNPALRDDPIRSLRLSQLAGLFDIPGVRFYNLQWHLPEHDEDYFCNAPLINVMEGVKSFETTAAIMDRLDLVISVDTAVAHLAGALGKRVWTLLPDSPDWRWLLHRNDTPWYPTMRLFRQPQGAGWEPVVAEVAEELKSETRRKPEI